MELHSTGRLLAMSANIILGWMCLKVTNTPALNGMELLQENALLYRPQLSKKLIFALTAGKIS
jgi:hypothetical protein